MSDKKDVTHPHTWMLPLSYKPKLEAVRTGNCTQTIRPDKDIRPGDYVYLFEWSGKPYRSPWAWKRRATVTEVMRFRLMRSGNVSNYYSGWMVVLDEYGYEPTPNPMNELALRDGISPPTGIELRKVLVEFYGEEAYKMTFVAITWSHCFSVSEG